MSEKRKNGTRRPVSWWTLVVGIALGVALTLLLARPLQDTRLDHSVLPVSNVSDPMLLTATAVIEGATATANALERVDPAAMTAPGS